VQDLKATRILNAVKVLVVSCLLATAKFHLTPG